MASRSSVRSATASSVWNSHPPVPSAAAFRRAKAPHISYANGNRSRGSSRLCGISPPLTDHYRLLQYKRLLRVRKIRCLHRIRSFSRPGNLRGKLQSQTIQFSGSRAGLKQCVCAPRVIEDASRGAQVLGRTILECCEILIVANNGHSWSRSPFRKVKVVPKRRPPIRLERGSGCYTWIHRKFAADQSQPDGSVVATVYCVTPRTWAVSSYHPVFKQ